MLKLRFVPLALFALVSLSLSAEPISLFDGRTFEGWEGPLESFRIEDGAIVGGTMEARIPKNQFLSTKQRFGDFELRVRFRLLGERANAGIQFRTERIPDHHEVIGYQADMGGKDGKYWGALYDESRRRKVLVGPDLDKLMPHLNLGDWNEYVIRAEGRRIQLWINGYQTVDYIEDDPDIPQEGVIALQIHSGGPSEAWYKDITVELLDAQE